MTDFFTDDHRQLQERFDSRALADTLAATTLHDTLDDDAIAFISGRAFFFLSTVRRDGQPTVSYKGGAPGFVRVVDPGTLLFPSYDGNGMYLSLGNIAGDGRVGLLFIDFEQPHRVRVHARAEVLDDPALCSEFPGAELVVRATVTEAFINCPRYIAPGASTEPAEHVPDVQGNAPVADWQRLDLLQPVLPDRVRARVTADGGTIDLGEYLARQPRPGDAQV